LEVSRDAAGNESYLWRFSDTVSRHLVEITTQKLQEFKERDLSPSYGTVKATSNGTATVLCLREGLQPCCFIVRRDFEESKITWALQK